jgi:hypothetical protein
MTKWAFLLAYCLALAIVVVIVVERQQFASEGLVATRELPKNWLLQSSDVGPGDKRARYTSKDISKATRLDASDTTLMPEIVINPGFVPLALTVDHALVTAGANAGRKVRICGNQSDALQSAIVQAMLCAEESAQCVAVIDIPSSAVSPLVAKADPAKALVVKLITQQCESK